jgi:hypothetical protein
MAARRVGGRGDGRCRSVRRVSVMAIATDYRECDRPNCHTRVLLARGVPALNWTPDPAGTVAVTFTHPRAARFLARGEEPGALEHRHSVHECGQVSDDAA